jgi:hypothetical protein
MGKGTFGTRKLQTPNSKLQRNFKLQAPMNTGAVDVISDLAIGASLEFGV